jgi:hypothetical protein
MPGTLVPLQQSEPTSLVQVDDQCAAVETWAEQCDSVPELRDATNKLAAIDEYLSRTSTEGRARVAAAMRRLEVRIGTLLGPAESVAGPGRGKPSTATDGLSRDQRHEFRAMAEHPEVVEDVIASSTDERPASRRQVQEAIRQANPPATKPRRPPLPDTAERAGWEFRKSVECIERIAEDERFTANKDQVAAHLRGHLTYALEVCQDLLDQLNQDGE